MGEKPSELKVENGKNQDIKKSNKVVRGFKFIFRAIWWLLKKIILCLLVLIAIILIGQLYGQVAEVGDDKRQLFKYYKETALELQPATGRISQLKDNLVTEAIVAEEDGKISIKEFITIEDQYRELESLSFKTAMELQNRNKISQDKDKAEAKSEAESESSGDTESKGDDNDQ